MSLSADSEVCKRLRALAATVTRSGFTGNVSIMMDAADRLEAAPKAPQDMNLRELFDHVAIVNDAIRAALLTHPGMTPMRQEPTPRQCASCGGYSHASFKKCINCSAVLG